MNRIKKPVDIDLFSYPFLKKKTKMIRIENHWVHAKDVVEIAINPVSPFVSDPKEQDYEIAVGINHPSAGVILKKINVKSFERAEIKATNLSAKITDELVRLKPNLITQ